VLQTRTALHIIKQALILFGLLSAATPDFIGPQYWPPNSPDLNPVDYTIWSILQERVYRCQIRDIDH